ncbi:MAG TPA: hypothetical protein VIY09_04840, partial [Rhizomicrobium sp.]
NKRPPQTRSLFWTLWETEKIVWPDTVVLGFQILAAFMLGHDDFGSLPAGRKLRSRFACQGWRLRPFPDQTTLNPESRLAYKTSPSYPQRE